MLIQIYKDDSQLEKESEILGLVLIRADRSKEPGTGSPADFIGIDISIIPPDRSINNIFFKKDIIDLLNALEYKINSSGSQNKIRLNELIDFNNNN